jgi:hypothetical protein
VKEKGELMAELSEDGEMALNGLFNLISVAR